MRLGTADGRIGLDRKKVLETAVFPTTLWAEYSDRHRDSRSHVGSTLGIAVIIPAVANKAPELGRFSGSMGLID